jgi:squalene-associated FAD-dependent desaturase
MILTHAQKPRLAIVGGGMAGMAAALAAAERGFDVELFEQGLALGGRAGSFHDTQVDQLVDFSPHISMGCCTNLADFCRRTGVDKAFDRDRTLHFIDSSGKRYEFTGSRWLPAPLHLLPGLFGLGYLSLADRLSIARALLKLIRSCPVDSPDSPTMAHWLAKARQSKAAVDGFWSIVLVSALGDTLEHVSVSAARKVFLDGFCATQSAYEVLVPKAPLQELWNQAGKRLAECGVKIHLKTPVRRVVVENGKAQAIELNDGTTCGVDFVIAAVSWKQIARLLGSEHAVAATSCANLASSPITAVHLWFDRPITPLPHAAIVGRLSQWLFAMGHDGTWENGDSLKSQSLHHYAVVISASQGLSDRDRNGIRQEVLSDLAALWSESRAAELIHSRVLTQASAVFSVSPGSDRWRPPATGGLANRFLAGDWTSTGWPATMEGAVRSGYQAVEALLASAGRPERIVVPDLKKGLLVRLIAGNCHCSSPG